MKIYIAGPMSGYKDKNFPAFFAAETELNYLGYKNVANPARTSKSFLNKDLTYNIKKLSKYVNIKSTNEKDLTKYEIKLIWTFFMKRDIAELIDCHMIVALKWWKKSKGASIEIKMAEDLDIPVVEIEQVNYIHSRMKNELIGK